MSLGKLLMNKKNLIIVLTIQLIILMPNIHAEKLRSTPFVIPNEVDIKNVNFDASALQESNISRAIITNQRVFAQSILTTEWNVYSLDDFNQRFEAIPTHETLSVSKGGDGVGPYQNRKDGNLLVSAPIFMISGDITADAVINNGNINYLQSDDNCHASAQLVERPIFTQIRCDQEDYQSFTKGVWTQVYDYTTIDRLELDSGYSFYSPTSAICGKIIYRIDGDTRKIDQTCTYLNEFPNTGNNFTRFYGDERYTLMPLLRGDLEIHTKMLYPNIELEEGGEFIGITCSQYSTEQRSQRFFNDIFSINPLGRILGFKQSSFGRQSIDESTPICSISYQAGDANGRNADNNGFELASNVINEALFDDLRLSNGNLKLFGQKEIDADQLSNVIFSFGRYRGVYFMDTENYNFKMLLNDNLGRNEMIQQYSTQVYEKVL